MPGKISRHIFIVINSVVSAPSLQAGVLLFHPVCESKIYFSILWNGSLFHFSFSFFWDLKISELQILEIWTLIGTKLLRMDCLKLVGTSVVYSGTGILGQFSWCLQLTVTDLPSGRAGIAVRCCAKVPGWLCTQHRVWAISVRPLQDLTASTLRTWTQLHPSFIPHGSPELLSFWSFRTAQAGGSIGWMAAEESLWEMVG